MCFITEPNQTFFKNWAKVKLSFEEALGYIAPCDIILKQLLGFLVVNLLNLLT